MRALALALLVLASPAAATAPPLPLDTIAAGCSGGVTGGGTVMRILADGRLVRLTLGRAGTTPRIDQLGFDLALYQRLAQALDEGGFNRLQGGPPGNITCWLERVWATGRGWRVQWAGTEPPATWPDEVRAAFAALRGA